MTDDTLSFIPSPGNEPRIVTAPLAHDDVARASSDVPRDRRKFSPISRPRIIEMVRDAAQHQVALIVAPAGYGKSVALTEFLSEIRVPVVRYNLRGQTGGLSDFVRGLVEALRILVPTAKETLSDALRSSSSATKSQDLADWLSRHISDLEAIVAIDDFHKVAEPDDSSIFLAQLIENTSSTVRWIIATRSTLALPVGSWVAYGTCAIPIDERDLSFNESEIQLVAAMIDATALQGDLVRLNALMKGWPAGISLSLRSAGSVAGFLPMGAPTREIVYSYLAEQILAQMDPHLREFVIDVAIVEICDVPIMESLGYTQVITLFERLRKILAFIIVDDGGIFRLHDLFRDFLAYNQRSVDADGYLRRIQRVALSLAAEHFEQALSLLRRSQSWPLLIDVLMQRASKFFREDNPPGVIDAVRALPRPYSEQNPIIIALRAQVELNLGNVVEATRLFLHALEHDTDASIQALIIVRYNTMSVGIGRLVDIERLESLLPRLEHDPWTTLHVASSLSLTYAIQGNDSAARQNLAKVLKLLDICEASERVTILTRVAIAYYYLSDFVAAERYAIEVSVLAEATSSFRMAASALSTLYAISSSLGNDNKRAFAYAEKMVTCSLMSGSREFVERGSISVLHIAAEIGDTETILRTHERLLASSGAGYRNDPFTMPEVMALEATWAGDFASAALTVQNRIADLFDGADVTKRHAFAAICYAVSGNRHEATVQLQRARESTDNPGFRTRFRSDLSIIFSAIAHVILENPAAARRLLQALQPINAASKSFWDFASRFCDESDILEDELVAIDLAGYGGYSRMFRNFVASRVKSAAPIVMTATEREIATFLDQGLRPKEIAERTGRSVYTVQNHIQSFIAKLGVSGREQALSIARRDGLLNKRLTSTDGTISEQAD